MHIITILGPCLAEAPSKDYSGGPADSSPSPAKSTLPPSSPVRNILTVQGNTLNNINREIAIFKIDIPGIGKILLAANRDSINNPIPLIQPNWDGITDPGNLPLFLNANASYGGTRLAKPEEGFTKAIESLLILAKFESDAKHRILNSLISDSDGPLAGLIDKNNCMRFGLTAPAGSGMRDIPKGYKVPDEFFKLKFRGGRCVIYPESKEVYEKLLARDSDLYDRTFRVLGGFLNGRLKADEINFYGDKVDEMTIPPGSLFLTPDYGSNAEVADILYKHTPHVLGVSPKRGGGGGKSSYTVSFLKGAFLSYLNINPRFGHIDTLVTLIGSAGAIGKGFTRVIEEMGYRNVRVSDLKYDLNRVEVIGDKKRIYFHSPEINPDGSEVKYHEVPSSWKVVSAEPGKYTNESLSGSKPGIYVMTTVGHELENSAYNLLPKESAVFLAHNFSFPNGFSGCDLASKLLRIPVDLFTGPQLTPGGAFYSRLEAAHRASKGISFNSKDVPPFPKVLVHSFGENLGFRLTEETLAPLVIEQARRLSGGIVIDSNKLKDVMRRMHFGTSFINHVVRRANKPNPIFKEIAGSLTI